MKRLAFILVMLFCVSVTYAQKGKVTQASSYLNAGKLDEAKKLIDEGIQHEKAMNDPRSHFIKGQIYQGIYESQNADYKKLDPNALNVAYEAYKKTIELDDKNKYTKQLEPLYQNLIVDFMNKGVDYYNVKNYKQALDNFKMVLEIETSPVVNRATADTAVIYNAAVAAQQAGEYADAEKFLKQSIGLNYEIARSYGMLATIYKEQGKTDEYIKALQRGYESHPDDSFLLVELINYYLQNDNTDAAEKYLDQAIAQDPGNVSFYRAKGSLYEKTGETDKAMEMYEQTIKRDPTDFIAHYNLGAIKLNRVVEKHNKVNDIMDVNKYNKALDEVLLEYDAVVPYFEKALELKPGETNTMQALKELYYKLKRIKPEYQKKYDQIDAQMKK